MKVWTRRRWLFLGCGLLLLAATRLLSLQGLVFPVRISSGSMADALLGPHYQVRCADCSFAFACDAEQTSQTGRAVCPNCGFDGNELNSQDRRPGQRVLIDRAAFAWRTPRRWELVAFRNPAGQPRLEVKRLVGLPREQVEIRGGEVYRDGQLLRKSLDQQRSLAILVHDSSHQPTGGDRQPRWAADEGETSGWRADSGEFRYLAQVHGPPRLDWLTYRHRSCFAGPTTGDDWPVVDNYGYNQGVSRSLHEVSDLMLRCHIHELRGGGQLAFLAHDGRQTWQVTWTPARGTLALARGGRSIARANAPPVQDGAARVEYSMCDDQVIFALDGAVLLNHPCEAQDRPFQPTSRPLGIAATDIFLRVKQLQVFRDVYYLDPGSQGRDWATPCELADDEFFVLGDNVPISRDSRLWRQPGIKRKSLIGKVLAPF